MSGASGKITPQTNAAGGQSSLHGKGDTYSDSTDTEDVRYRNMVSAKAIADIVRTSLGPRQNPTSSDLRMERVFCQKMVS